MAIQIVTRFENIPFEAIERAKQKSPALFQKGAQLEVQRVNRQMRDELLREQRPQSPLPFIWSLIAAAQQRARAYYFGVILKGKKGRGGRHQRTGKMIRAFRLFLASTLEDGRVILENRAKGSIYVHGDRQVPSHQRTGHPLVKDIANRYVPVLRRRLINIWHTVGDPFAGVR